MYSVYRKVSCRKARSIWICRAITSTGTMLRKKGYSGTAMFTKEEPISVSYGLGIEEHDHEGRVITAEFPEYYIVTCYTPNSKDGLARLDYRMTWEDAFFSIS